MTRPASLFALVLIVAFLAACGGKKATPDERVTETPPADDEVVMPQGGPLMDDDGSAQPADPEGAPAADADAPATGGEGDAFVARGELEQFLDRGQSYVLTLVTVEPVHRDDGFQGYQITDVTRGAREFLSPQMRVGDIVTHINGVRIMRPEDYMQAWRSLDKVGSIRIDFIRQNQPMTAVWVVR